MDERSKWRDWDPRPGKRADTFFTFICSGICGTSNIIVFISFLVIYFCTDLRSRNFILWRKEIRLLLLLSGGLLQCCNQFVDTTLHSLHSIVSAAPESGIAVAEFGKGAWPGSLRYLDSNLSIRCEGGTSPTTLPGLVAITPTVG